MYIDKLVNATKLVTFSDLYLLPGRTDTDPDNINLQGRVTKNIILQTPYISSPMDTVTGSNMAIAMAREGGVGILHRNCRIEEEVEMAKKVKRAESFVMTDVVTIKPDITIKEAKALMNDHNISGLPVTNNGGNVIGILTKRDVRFAADDSTVEEMMSKKVVSAGSNLTIEEAQTLLHKHRIEKLVIVDENNHLAGLVTVKDLERRGKYPLSTRDENGRLVVGAAIGPFDEERAKALDPYVDFLVVDLAHGHNMNALRSAAKISKIVEAEIVYGNLGSYESVEDVVTTMDNIAGIRVGIGSGSICSTSVVTKASAPSLYSTFNVASAVKDLGLDLPVISDGGIRNAGDAALCFGAGASAIMMGSLFAGCRESPGVVSYIDGRMVKPVRGMGSQAAKEVRYALDRYSQPAKGVPEGVEGFVPFRGTVADVVNEFSAGLRAAFGYSGAGNVKEMHTNAKFGVISSQGIRETTPHDIIRASE
jgi:IMP dehydrogenase